MAVKIRLSRIGRKHVPVFRIVAVDSREKRDGKYLDNLGTYDPVKGVIIQFNEESIKNWISKGAQLSDSVKKLQRLYKTQKKERQLKKSPSQK